MNDRLAAVLAFLRRVDPSTWIILLGVLLRVDVVLRFDAVHGYDSHAHFRYTELLAGGEVPRVGVNTWASQHPPVFYALALALEKLGLGHAGGQWISLISGAARLVIADRIFRRLEVDARFPSARLIANAIHAFIPVGIRMDAFYSPESIAATMCLLAVWLAVIDVRVVWAGAALGLALLSKATAVVTVPAVAFAVTLGRDRVLTKQGVLRLIACMTVAGAITLTWAWGNIAEFGTPYPNAYRVQKDEVWSRPLFQRHGDQYYRPRFALSELELPFYTRPPLSMPNVLVIDAWGDYYNFLNRGLRHHRPPPEAANGRELGLPRLWVHRVLAVLGLIFTLVLTAGTIGATRRLVRREMTSPELAIAILGAGYVFIMVWYAIWVPHEHDGPAKAAYALGASAVLSWWTARPLSHLASKNTALRAAIVVLAALPVLLAIVLRICW